MEHLTGAGRGAAPQRSQCDKGYQTRLPRGAKDAKEDRGWHQVTLELARGRGGCFLEERAEGQGWRVGGHQDKIRSVSGRSREYKQRRGLD